MFADVLIFWKQTVGVEVFGFFVLVDSFRFVFILGIVKNNLPLSVAIFIWRRIFRDYRAFVERVDNAKQIILCFYIRKLISYYTMFLIINNNLIQLQILTCQQFRTPC